MEPNTGSIILPPGTLLDDGNIVLKECMGQGGFGITYKAFDKTRNEHIVVKEFFPSKMVTRAADNSVLVPYEKQEIYQNHLRSFCREAKIIHALKAHPNIVKVYFTLEENNTAYYGMELLQGMDLARYLNKNKKLSFEDAYHLLLPVLDALKYVHSQNVLHRDISPNNIYMARKDGSADYMPILIDFGAAHVARSGFTKTFPKAYKLGYSPYEQVSGNTERQGTWTDVYSMCATMYYAITHTIPPSSSVRVLNGEQIARPCDMGVKISEPQEFVLLRGMSLNTKDRQQTIEQLMMEIQQTLISDTHKKRRSDWEIRSESIGFESVVDDSLGPESFIESKPVIPPVPNPDPIIREGLPNQGLAVGVLFLETVLFYGLALLLSPVWFAPIGYAVMMLLNTAFSFAGLHGSLLMPLARMWVSVEDDNRMRLVVYHLLRSILVLSLLDALIAWIRKDLSLCEKIAKVKVVPFEQVQHTQTTAVTHVNSARLVCNAGNLAGKTMDLLSGSSLGREASMVTYVLPGDAHVSKRHCEFVFVNNCWYLKDTKSKNGTVVDGVKVENENSVRLKSGSRIYIGHYEFTFVSEMR
ncbi:MAG: protein kinase [Clostridia bacterium]|nr:protein kinase [Clostridia bacterium]